MDRTLSVEDRNLGSNPSVIVVVLIQKGKYMLSMHSQSVNVDRLKLLDKLRENRDAHKAAYILAVAGFRDDVLTTLLTLTAAQQTSNVAIDLKDIQQLSAPVSYESEYDNVIEMLEISVDGTIQLDSSAFKAYWKDEWSWKRSFMVANSKYITGVAVGGLGGAM